MENETVETFKCRVLSALLLTFCTALSFQGAGYSDTHVQSPAPGGPVAATPIESAPLTLGGNVILRLYGANPEVRVDKITDRLEPVLAHPDIKPSDVVVYTPAGSDPVIYVLGRNLINVDKVSAKFSGIGTPLQTAVLWAHKLQQTLPLVDIRLANESEPTIPTNPPLLITNKFANVGGSVGEVDWNGHVIITLMASPVPGVTPAEYTDAISTRLSMDLYGVASKPMVVTTQPSPKDPVHSVDLMINGVRLISATASEAKAARIASPAILAGTWSTNLQTAISSWISIIHTVPPST